MIGENTAMAIYKRKKSKNWFSQFNYKGKTYIKSTRTNNRQTAAAIDRQHYDDVVRAEQLGMLGQITIDDALELFHNRPLKRDKDRRYQEKCITRTLLKYIDGKLKMSQIQDRHVIKLTTKMFNTDYSAAYINRIIHTLNQTNNICRKHGFDVSSADFQFVPKPKKRIRFLTHDEERLVLDDINPQKRIRKFPNEVIDGKDYSWDAYDFTVLSLDTGMRSSELLILNWSVINFEKKSIRVYRPKVDNESILFMTPRVEEVLRRRYTAIKQPNELLFEARHKRRIQRKIIRSMDRVGLNAAEVVEEKGTRAIVHSLRKTFASRCIMAGISIEKVSRMLGHSNIKMTQDSYAFLAPDLGTEEAARVLANFNISHTKPKLVAVN